MTEVSGLYLNIVNHNLHLTKLELKNLPFADTVC